jgi:hypothetical protein
VPGKLTDTKWRGWAAWYSYDRYAKIAHKSRRKIVRFAVGTTTYAIAFEEWTAPGNDPWIFVWLRSNVSGDWDHLLVALVRVLAVADVLGRRPVSGLDDILTLDLPCLSAFGNVLFLLTGQEKAGQEAAYAPIRIATSSCA